MNTTRIRPYKALARTTVLATATGFFALGLAANVSADAGTVLNSPVGVGGCPGTPPHPCGKPISLPFTTTQPNVEVVFTKNPNSDCPNFNVTGNFDGATPVTFGATQPLAAGNHTLNLDASCASGSLTSWGGNVQVDNIKVTGQPAGPPAAATPKEGPTVSWNPILGGLRATVTDRSGVASQCQYASSTKGRQPFARSFALGANATTNVDIVPAVPAFQNWAVSISCDNGTKTDAVTFF